MSDSQMLERIIPMTARVPAWRFRRKEYRPEDVSAIRASVTPLSKLPFLIFSRPRPTLSEIRAVASQHRPDFIVIDYLQRCALPKGDIRAYQIGDLLSDMKTYAQDSGARIVIGCQLDRQRDRTAAMPPVLADIKDSGSIEAEADQVVLLWNPPEAAVAKFEGWTPPSAGAVAVVAIVAKNRSGGPAGVWAHLELHGEFVEFRARVEINTSSNLKEEDFL
jgi:replicative DNA helicase